MSVKQNLFVSVFVHKCLMMLNDVEYTTFKMFVTQISNYPFVISFQLMFYKTLPLFSPNPFTWLKKMYHGTVHTLTSENCKVCSINFETPDNDFCSAYHVYPISSRTWIISILFIVNRFNWGLN